MALIASASGPADFTAFLRREPEGGEALDLRV